MMSFHFMLPKNLRTDLAIAAASAGLSNSAYVRASVRAAIERHSAHDPLLRHALDLVNGDNSHRYKD